MEVKTQEIIRYIDLRFKEQDLKDLRNEIDELKAHFVSSPYRGDKDKMKKMVKMLEFYIVVIHALDEIKS